MHAGEIFICLIFNTVLIFGLHFWQTWLLREKLKRIHQEVQDLEDMVVAIVEEFGEAVTETPAAPETKLPVPSQPEVTVELQSEVKREELPISSVAPDKPNNAKVPAVKVQPQTAVPLQAKIKGSIVSSRLSEAAPAEIPVVPVTQRNQEPKSAQMPEVKQELIPPVKPKAKPKAKPKPKAKVTATVPPVATGSSPADAVLPVASEQEQSPAVKFSLPLAGGPDSKRQKVLNLANQGMEVAEIAKQLKMGQGEIQLILGLIKKG